jgi:hypothetical protein
MREIASVTVVWYATKLTSVAFTVEVSSDGVTYERLDSGSLTGKGTLSTLRAFVPASGRYVRLSLTPAEGSKCPGVYEVGIHGNSVVEQAAAR